ncbi:TPA: glycosyltransferase, partial [Streptococcus pneumoniae]
MNERMQILGVTIDPLTMKETVDAVEQYVLKKHPL